MSEAGNEFNKSRGISSSYNANNTNSRQKDKKLEVLIDQYGTPNRNAPGYCSWRCPECAKEGGDSGGNHFSYHTESGSIKCWANEDHTQLLREHIDSLLSKSKRTYKKEKVEEIDPIDIPENELNAWAEAKKIANPAKVAEQYKLKYCSNNKCFLIPAGERYKLKWGKDDQDRWDNQTNKKKADYLELSAYTGQKYLVAIEGLSNLFASAGLADEEFKKKFYVVTSTDGVSSTSKVIEKLDPSRFEAIISLLDVDEAGISESKRIAEKYSNVCNLELDVCDLRDFLNADAVLFNKLKELLEQKIAWSEAITKAAWNYLRNPNLIDEFLSDMEKFGIVGEKENLFRIYLCCLSYKFENCLGLILKGATSSGKTTIMKAVTGLMPEGIVHPVSSQSEQALNYWTDISHKIILITEEKPPEDEFWEVMSAWRQLIEDNEITRIIVDNNEKDIHKKRKEIKVKGPIVYLSTTTQSKLHEENENRLLVFNTNDSQEHVGDVIQKILEEEDDENLELEKQFIIAKHRKAVKLLQPFKWKQIKIPFKKQIQFSSYGPEAMRDIKKLIKAVKLITFLHQYQREESSSSLELPLTDRWKQTPENYASIPENSSLRHSLPVRNGLISSLGDYNLAVSYFKDYFDANSSDISKDLQDKWNVIYKFSGDNNTFTYDDCKKKWNLKKSRVQVLVKEMLGKNMIVQVSSSDEMFNKMEGKKNQYRWIAWNLNGSGLVDLHPSSQSDVTGGRTNSEELTADSSVNASAAGLTETKAIDQQLAKNNDLDDVEDTILKEKIDQLNATNPGKN